MFMYIVFITKIYICLTIILLFQWFLRCLKNEHIVSKNEHGIQNLNMRHNFEMTQ